MNQTTNYNFNVPVGSDVVNPLVQDFPNWTSLDTILKNISETGVGTATHTKAGTVHTITLADDDIPMFRFQATGDFDLNDSIVVDGIPVSALMVSGEALPDGAFVIGSMVLCELRDTLLTVYTSGTNANTLEGHAASYFATASDLSTVDGKADANKILIDNLSDRVDHYNFGTEVTLPLDDPYFPLSDGYVYLENNVTYPDGTITVNSTFSIGGVIGNFALFVKKGTRLYRSGNSQKARFVPFVQ